MSVAQAAPACGNFFMAAELNNQTGSDSAGLGILESEATGKMSIPGFYIIFCLFF